MKMKQAAADIAELAGCAFVLWGIAAIYPPAAWIVAGILLALAGAAMSDRKGGDK